MRKLVALAAVALAASVGVVPAVAARSLDGPYCATRWGSLAKQDMDYTSAQVTNVRAGRHDCFDRLVVDLGPRVPGLPGPDEPGYQAQYVAQLAEPATGDPRQMAGGAILSIVVHAPAYDVDGNLTYDPADRDHIVGVSGFRTFRQVALLGSFEGQTNLGLGVRARLPFRVFVLAGPGEGSRLVIDVAHRW